MKTQTLVQYLDDLLNIHNIEDASLNGLQVENRGEVHKIALAVDVSFNSIEKAKEEGADFLFVHHGLYWGKPIPVTGIHYQRIRLLLESDIAMYAAHLPLDIHPSLGNNALIGPLLNWPITGDFGKDGGITLGKEISFDKPASLTDIVDQVERGLKCQVQVWPFGKKDVQRIAYVSGGALIFLEQAIQADMDAFITGEPKHSVYWLAKEANINVLLAGHYATETLGVKAVGKHLEEQFGLKTVFIDMPTGY